MLKLLVVILMLLCIPAYIFIVPWLVWKAYLFAIVAPFHTPVLTYWQVFAILFILNIITGFVKFTVKK